jgi:hypothetical protein
MAPKTVRPSTPEEEEPELDDMEDEEEDEYMDEEMGFDLTSALEPFLATEDGQTVATALVTIGKHLEMQNKILVKILSKMAKEA